jgi:hypothetical protein
MAMQVTSQTLYDNARNVVMRFTGVSDGSGDEINVKKVDVAAMSPPAGASLKIRRVNYSVAGGILRMLWDANDPAEFADLQGFDHVDYRRFGGLINGGGDTATGSILFSTLGFDAGSSYDVTIEMIKGI